MTSSSVLVERDGEVAWLIMNRPGKRNAINAEMSAAMYLALDELAADEGVKVVVLTGAGEAFSAGIDLAEPSIDVGIRAQSRADASGLPPVHVRLRDRSWMADRLLSFEKVTIAMVNGWCVGGAFSPLLACDLAIAADEAPFSISEANWGGLPAGMTTKLLVETLNIRDAMYYILTAATFDGIEAARIGVVNRSVPAAELRDATTALARDLCQKDQFGLMASKDTCRAVRSMDWRESAKYTNMKMALIRQMSSAGTVGQAVDRFLNDKSYKPALGTFDGGSGGHE